jgi:hypothetical protein
MCPHKDMFVDYCDIREEQQYVRLGNQNKWILIHGRGTMCLEVEGRKIAYAHTLQVPQLSAILLSTRVHRRSAIGYSFLADSSGCFLTYPTFQKEVDDTFDCTIPCQRVLPDTHTYDFDSLEQRSRSHLPASGSPSHASLSPLCPPKGHCSRQDLVTSCCGVIRPRFLDCSCPLRAQFWRQ